MTSNKISLQLNFRLFTLQREYSCYLFYYRKIFEWVEYIYLSFCKQKRDFHCSLSAFERKKNYHRKIYSMSESPELSGGFPHWDFIWSNSPGNFFRWLLFCAGRCKNSRISAEISGAVFLVSRLKVGRPKESGQARI